MAKQIEEMILGDFFLIAENSFPQKHCSLVIYFL